MKFFDKNVLLTSRAAKKIYAQIKDLPIIDYHCHLSVKEIAENAPLSTIGEAWLKADHYKWRSMRLCGVEERFVTGDAPYEEKFYKYAEILPKLAAAANVEVVGMIISVDRMEKALNSDLSAVKMAKAEYGIDVYSVVNMNDIIEAIEQGVIEGKEHLPAMYAYRETYGA